MRHYLVASGLGSFGPLGTKTGVGGPGLLADTGAFPRTRSCEAFRPARAIAEQGKQHLPHRDVSLARSSHSRALAS
jgi:hypothetical protein